MIDEEKKKWCIHIHTHTTKYYSPIKRMKSCLLWQMGRTCRNYVNEVNQRQIPYNFITCEIWKTNITTDQTNPDS